MIYFIQEAGNEKAPIKIGYCSGDPISRLQALQTGYPAKLAIICVLPGPQSDEGREHEKWKHLRVHGEWFRADPDLLEYIRSEASEKDPTKRHRTEATALAQAKGEYAEYALRPTGLRKQCPRCWKLGWVFLVEAAPSSAQTALIVWDGDGTWGHIDICDQEAIFRPTFGCGSDAERDPEDEC
jgi:T5orf172 domain